jgi:hypothetical protein
MRFPPARIRSAGVHILRVAIIRSQQRKPSPDVRCFSFCTFQPLQTTRNYPPQNEILALTSVMWRCFYKLDSERGNEMHDMRHSVDNMSGWFSRCNGWYAGCPRKYHCNCSFRPQMGHTPSLGNKKCCVVPITCPYDKKKKQKTRHPSGHAKRILLEGWSVKTLPEQHRWTPIGNNHTVDTQAKVFNFSAQRSKYQRVYSVPWQLPQSPYGRNYHHSPCTKIRFLW